MKRSMEALQAELRNLSEVGTTVAFTNEEAETLDIKNAYDELEVESEVENG